MNLKVLQVNVNEPPEVKEIKDDVSLMEDIVGGHIEQITLSSDILLLVNEEGKLKELPINYSIHNVNTVNGIYNDELVGHIVGNVIFVGVSGEEFRSLTDTEIDMLLNKFNSDGSKFIQNN